MLLYAITSRNLLPGTESERQAALVALARHWAREGVDYIQIREKDLSPTDLGYLVGGIAKGVRKKNTNTHVLVNGPAEIALAAGADGVHLPGSAPTGAADQARQVFQIAGREAATSRACHSLEEIRAAGNVSLIVFAPVFEKVSEEGTDSTTRPGVGLNALREACRTAHPTPVIALGGVTTANAVDCIAAGAAGVAGIRLFLGDEWRKLRSL